MDAISDGEVTLLAQRYAEVVQALELAPSEPLLVLPNGDFFPDVYRADQSSLEALVARMCGYAGLEREVEVRLVGEQADSRGAGSCGTGSCGTSKPGPSGERTRIIRSGDRWLLEVPHAELGEPIVLSARLAAAISAMLWIDRGNDEALGGDAAEMAAVALGFGVLELEASYLYRKGCGGPQVGRGTALDCRSLSILFALYLAREGLTPKAAKAELGVTQRALVSEAWAIVDESPGLVEALRDNLPRVAEGRFKLREGRSLLTRLFAKRRSPKSREDEALAALERGASVDELAVLLGADGQSSRARGR